MEIKIYVNTLEEVAKDHGMFVEELIDSYGQDAVKLYWADSDKYEGNYTGVQYKDGTYSVYGLRRDVEGITLGRMLEILTGQFIK